VELPVEAAMTVLSCANQEMQISYEKAPQDRSQVVVSQARDGEEKQSTKEKSWILENMNVDTIVLVLTCIIALSTRQI
jgi:hypothetical protein